MRLSYCSIANGGSMQVWAHVQRQAGILLLALVAVTVAAPRAHAAPIVIRFDAAISDPDFAVSASDANLDVTPGSEITLANGTNVGAYFFDDEFVNVSSSAALSVLQYRIQGGGGDHPTDGYSLTGWGELATLTFSDFELDSPGSFTGVSLLVDTATSGQPRVIGAGGGALVSGTDYLFDASAESLTIYLGGLGVLDFGAPALGTLNFTLAFEADGPPEPPSTVPEPASLLLVGTGIAAAARRVRTKRHAAR
jgi:hypothetical protein